MHSMTGFGRGTAATHDWQTTVEITAVNRKQAEIVLQAPRELAELEPRIRKLVLASVSRGRIQISISLDRPTGIAAAVKIDEPLARAFDAAFAELGRITGHPMVPTTADYLRQPGIISIGTPNLDLESAWSAIEPALTAAIGQLATMRSLEGEHLKADLLSRLSYLKTAAATIAATAPDRLPRQRDLLFKRLRDANLDLDPADDRVLREIALFADRCDISEEITRLDSHFLKFREYLDASESPGRALDFLCQELFREFNTIGSKANDADIAQTIVRAKTELEKIREQVQNVE